MDVVHSLEELIGYICFFLIPRGLKRLQKIVFKKGTRVIVF